MMDGFHPLVQAWFHERFREPTPPQSEGWPVIQTGRNTLIAAPTGSGKTLTAFLSAIDQLIREAELSSAVGRLAVQEDLPGVHPEGEAAPRRKQKSAASLPHETRVLYVSPLKALGNDVRKNLQQPLAELRARAPELPEIRIMVRSGDTPQAERQAMVRKPPHILVTTPESLYILLTSAGGRKILSTVRTVIVDEIHAVLGDKRGAHLALSLERLETLTGGMQRIGLSATQKPLSAVGDFLVGPSRDCELVDVGHLRELDLAVEIPESPLEAICSHETWGEIYTRIAQLIDEHRTTLIFVGTRKMAERVGAQLSRICGEDRVTCHHSSMSKERRLIAEQLLKEGQLKALVATASLELGIDVGDVDLVIQIGATRSIAVLLQRVGRAGHALDRIPKGRIFPLTQDELVEAAALLRSIRTGQLDRTPQPAAPRDILAQQVVAECVTDTWDEEELLAIYRRAWPYRALEQEEFDEVVRLHTDGRSALLHRDGVNRRIRATRRARLTAITSGGAIPDRADYQVLLEPEGTVVGTVDEDFAIESSAGDIFQLGNASWQVLKVERGIMRVADAKGIPPSLPFWFGEGPSRTQELSAEIGEVREQGVELSWLETECMLGRDAAQQLAQYLREGQEVLGAAPTQSRVIAERFFDESGGMQLIVHAPFGGRINRAWGLALRKRFCRHFGFELQAAANEEAIVLSLGPMHSFPLAEIFEYLSPETGRQVLTQALLPTPMFSTRWRWNVTRSLMIERMRNGKRVAPQLLRMRADDLLAEAFPDVVACGENLPPGDLEIPQDHPILKQTIEDCLTEAMDVDGFLEVIGGVRAGRIETVAVDVPEPSAFARGILHSQPYTFLDDAPLEERRTQAVATRRVLDPRTADELGELDADAVARVQEEAWPHPEDAEEVHAALLWMGYVTEREAEPWALWIEELRAQERVVLRAGRWFAAEADANDHKKVARGRMEALGPVFPRGSEPSPGALGADIDEATLLQLESDGIVLRVRMQGRQAWCERRLLSRIYKYTLDRLRKEIEPVSAADFLRFLACWQHVDPEYQLEGPGGLEQIVAQLAGFEAPAVSWERDLFRVRMRQYQSEWLDSLTLGGKAVWGRVWGRGVSAIKSTPISVLPRADLRAWEGLAGKALPSEEEEFPSWRSRKIFETLQERGALFQQDLLELCGPLPTDFETGVQELIALGLLTGDAYSALRQFLVAPSKRKHPVLAAGRWSLFRTESYEKPEIDFVARQLLERYGVVFKRILKRERIPIPWRDLYRVYRRMELRGDVRGGRFVAGFAGEQFALPTAVDLLRKLRREGPRSSVQVGAADPLNLQGILTPEERTPSNRRKRIEIS